MIIRTQVPCDWLDQIDGQTVENAIKYLSTLDPKAMLRAELTGDTHGVDIISYLETVREATLKERLQDKLKRLEYDMKICEGWMDKYLHQSTLRAIDSKGRPLSEAKQADRVSSFLREVENSRKRLAEFNLRKAELEDEISKLAP